MVSTGTLLACIATLFVSFLLPLALLAWYWATHRHQGVVSAWMLGAAGFFVPQMLIRIPILSALSAAPSFIRFSQQHAFLYTFALAFTAGLFELAGRIAAAKLIQRKGLSCSRALAAGLGHGGVESILLIGMAYINNLICIVMINTGALEALGAQMAAAGGDPAVLDTVRAALVDTPTAMFLLAGLERILTMITHVGMSMMVCCGIHTGKLWQWSLACLAFHTALDLAAGIPQLIGGWLGYLIVYLFLAVMASIAVVLTVRVSRRWQK